MASCYVLFFFRIWIELPSVSSNRCVTVSVEVIGPNGGVGSDPTSDTMCDYRRRNEEWRPSIYSRLYNLIVKGDYMSKA